MNLGEFIIKIGTQGDTKELQTTIKRLEEAEKKSRGLISYLKRLKNATSEQEKALIKKNYAQQVEIDKLSKAKQNQEALASTMKSSIGTTFKMVGAISAAITMLDRMGNSLLKANQMYITFGKQTDMSITRLNRMTGVAKLSGMNLSAEQVAGDLQGLQQKFFNLGLTGEGSGIFAQLGINPLGMKSDQFIEVLRNRTKGMSGTQKSYILSQLGLSQEWLNVLDLSNEKFAEYVKMSKELQLSEEERKKLATYTFKQQKNNMQWELAKQKLLIALIPSLQKIMDFTSKIALDFAKWFEKNPAWLNALKDVLILLAGGQVIKTIKALQSLLAFGGLSAVGGTVAKAGGAMALRGGLAGASNFMGAAGLLLKIALGAWAIYDIITPFFKKEDAQDVDTNLEPVEGDRYQYHNIKSTMTNNFFNNPQPQAVVVSELDNAMNRFLANQYR